MFASAAEPTEHSAGASITPGSHISSLIEKVLEYRFLGSVTAELLRRGLAFEVLRSDVDSHGHDLVIEATGVVRHIQLKAMIAEGKRAGVTINSRLSRKPSACVIWMTYNPDAFELLSFGWFGGAPGEPLPSLGKQQGRHTKSDASGLKALRPLHRIVKRRQFTWVADVRILVDLLFGIPPAAGIVLLYDHLREREQSGALQSSFAADVASGMFSTIPDDLTFNSAVELAHIIDGYRLADRLGIEDPIAFAERQFLTAQQKGAWANNPAILWICLFLEHRRWRQAAGLEPDEKTLLVLDKLARQLVTALKIRRAPH